MSQDTDMLNIHCDLVNYSLVDGEECDIIYSLSTSVLTPSDSFTLESRRITHKSVGLLYKAKHYLPSKSLLTLYNNNNKKKNIFIAPIQY